MSPPGPDDTVRLPPSAAPGGGGSGGVAPRPSPGPRGKGYLVGGALILLLAAGAAFLLRSGPPAEAPQPVVQAPVAPAPAIPAALAALPLADETTILAHRGDRLAIFRLAPNPAVLVLDFPSLAEQGRMLNRVAALIEKAGLPRDRVLDDAALGAAIRDGGTTPETYYYGHNYRAGDLFRFFALADRDGVRLNAEEERLRALLRDIGWLRQDAPGALVSVPQAGVEPWLDQRARAAMLRHELSHGEFFTNPAYAAVVWRFWREMLTEPERQRFRAMLAEASYDPAQEEVMANEAHAFLLHTPDERFFNPGSLGLAPDRVAALRAAFIAALPGGWRRDAMR
jgi:hypothetical protein